MKCKFLHQVFSKESLKIRLRRKSFASLDCTAKSRLKFKTLTSEVQKVMKLFLASAAHCFGKIILRAHHDPQEGFNHSKQPFFFSDLARNICTSSVRLSTKSTDYFNFCAINVGFNWCCRRLFVCCHFVSLTKTSTFPRVLYNFITKLKIPAKFLVWPISDNVL